MWTPGILFSIFQYFFVSSYNNFFSNILLETFVTNLIFPTSPSPPDIGQNSDGGISDFRISGQSLIKENCRNIKLGPLTKLHKRNKATSKELTMTPCRKIVMSLSFFQFISNLEKSGSLIPDPQSVKPMFSLIVTFNLTKTENRTKISLIQLSHYCLE